jgi:hypothetical protein
MRYAVTLWFVDSQERNQRLLLDQQQSLETNHTTAEVGAVTKTVVEEDSKELHLALLVGSNDSSHLLQSFTYRIQYPSNENTSGAFQNSQLDVSPTEIKITSADKRIADFFLPLDREICPHQTIAKYSKRSGVLSLTVFYSPPSGVVEIHDQFMGSVAL